MQLVFLRPPIERPVATSGSLVSLWWPELALRPFRLEEVKIKQIADVAVRADSAPPSASARVKVLAVGGDRAGAIQHQRALQEFRVEFVEEDGAWRVRSYENLGNKRSRGGS